MIPNEKNLKHGFTLIELLVVIAVIAILISISVFGIQGARSSARDAGRKSDLESIRSALEMYKADTGAYPATADNWVDVNGSNVLTDAIVPDYISEMPVDPMDSNIEPCSTDGYGYFYKSVTPNDGSEYYLVTGLENQETTNCTTACSGTPPASCYLVINP